MMINFLIKEVNVNHKRNDHKIENVVIQGSQLNIGLIYCQYCFLQNNNNINYQYSLNLMQFLEDVFNLLHYFWKINKFILEIESALFYPEDFIDDFLEIAISKEQTDFRLIKQFKDTQQHFIPYRSYISLLPKFLAILGTNNITIYDIKSGIKFSIINVGYQNNNIQLFSFTKDQNDLILASDKPIYYLIYNMKEKQIQQMQNSQESFIECINYNNQNYLFFYDQCFKILSQNNKHFVIVKFSNNFPIQIILFKQSRFIIKLKENGKTQLSICKDNFQFTQQYILDKYLQNQSQKYQNLLNYKKFKLQQIRASRMIRLYYKLISNSNKLIRRISSQDQFIRDIYFISQDESYIVSFKLSFYEISTGKIAFEIRPDGSEEVLDVKVGDGQIKNFNLGKHLSI
ncbi:unnamed protein product [Paramecium primaurelia]|uniref:WD40-repeat-containing domain n=1 Tax=Paramecium primaurelia TaxID=5886 RepID=A0A8S1QP01_PARPR|nr:unnamed protein product [Paramecium primaurelia]